MSEEPKGSDKDIEDILSDLDGILHNLTGAPAEPSPASPPLDPAGWLSALPGDSLVQPKTAPAPAIVQPPVESKPAPAPQPTPAPAPQAKPAPAPKLQPAPVRPPVELQSPAASGTSASPPPPSGTALPSAPPAPVPRPQPVAFQPLKPPAAPAPAPQTAPAPAPAPARVVPKFTPVIRPKPAAAPAPTPVPAPKPEPAPVQPPVELQSPPAPAPEPVQAPVEFKSPAASGTTTSPSGTALPSAPPAPEVKPEPKVEAKPELKVEEPKVEAKPEPKVEEPKPELKVEAKPEPKVEEPKPELKVEEPKASVGVPLPKPTPPEPDDPKIPKAQIRRIAFLYATGQQPAYNAFERFLKTVALKVSKKPLQVRNQATLEVPAGASAADVLAAVKAAGAVGAMGFFTNLPEAQVREIEEAFAKEDFFLRVIPPEQAQKRTYAMDMTFEIMLLREG